jgi:hypothetical protein
MPADSLSARHLRSDCCLYRPGHLVHWIQADHGRVLHQPRWELLRTPSDTDGSTACFCVVHDDHPDRCPCATAVPGAIVLDRLLSAGGGIIGRDEVLDLVDGLDHGTGEPPGRQAPDS